MPRLFPDDYRLLDEMNQRGGIARISDGRPRHGAEHLVEVGLATSRALNMSDVEYEMTALRRGQAGANSHQRDAFDLPVAIWA